MIFLMLILPFLLYPGTSSSERLFSEQGRLQSPDAHAEMLNSLVRKELCKRLPKSQACVINDYPTLALYNRITFSFEVLITLPSLRIQSKEEGITALVPYAQAVVDTINNIPEIRPYLLEFPLPIFMWDVVAITGKDPKTREPYHPPYLASVRFVGTSRRYLEFSYWGKDPERPNVTYDTFYDTLKKTFGSIPEEFKQMEIPRFDSINQKKPKVLPQVKKYAGITNEMKDEFNYMLQYAKNNNLTFIAYQNTYFIERPKDKRVFSEMVYAAQERRLTLEEARDLALKICSSHAQFYLPTGLFNFVNAYRKKGEEILTNPIDAQKYLGLRLSFWDQYIDRINPPYIAEVRVYGKRARYYVSDELQRLKLIHEEELPVLAIDVPLSNEVLKMQNEKTSPKTEV